MKITVGTLALCAVIGSLVNSQAATTVTVDPAASWLGFMNVSNLPANGGAFQFGSTWGSADLKAVFAGPVLTLSPNSVGDTNEYWYQGVGTNPGGPGAPGNKLMGASMYVESGGGVLAGQVLTFTGLVLSNTFTSAHSSVAFIKDFAPDYSSFNVISAPLVDGVFSISLATVNDPARHVQYGFETIGVNVWVTDTAPFGAAQVTAIPEPAGVTLAGLGAALCAIRRRRR